MSRERITSYFSEGFIRSLPFLSCLGFLFLGLFPFRIPFFIELFVPFFYISLFCWLFLRPDLLPPLSVFCLGVLSDLMYANPLGVETLICMLLYLSVYSQRRFLIGHSFIFLWGTFALLMLPLFIIQWSLNSLLRWHVMPFDIMIGQWLLLIGFYPIIAGLCSKLYNMYLDETI